MSPHDLAELDRWERALKGSKGKKKRRCDGLWELTHLNEDQGSSCRLMQVPDDCEAIVPMIPRIELTVEARLERAFLDCPSARDTGHIERIRALQVSLGGCAQEAANAIFI